MSSAAENELLRCEERLLVLVSAWHIRRDKDVSNVYTGNYDSPETAGHWYRLNLVLYDMAFQHLLPAAARAEVRIFDGENKLPCALASEKSVVLAIETAITAARLLGHPLPEARSNWRSIQSGVPA